MHDLLSRMSVKQKLMVPVSVLVCLVFLVLGVVLNSIITKNAMDTFADDTQRQAEQVDNAMDIFLNGLRDGLVNMANDPILKQGGSLTKYYEEQPGGDGMVAMDPQGKGGFELAAYQLFQRFGEANKNAVSVISYGTTDGGYLQYPAIKRKADYDSRKRSWFKDSMADTSKVRITKPFKTSKGTPTVGIFAVVKGNDGQPQGVLGLNIDLPVVTDMIANIKIGETGYIMMLDADGVIIADPKHPDVNFQKLEEANLGGLSTTPLKAELQEVDLDGTTKIVQTYRSEKTGYQYITLVDKSQVMASVSHMRTALIIALLVALLLIFAVTWKLADVIVAPLRDLESAASRMANGDLRDIQVATEADDEIGRLSRSFQQMVDDLKKLLHELKESADELSGSSVQMSGGVQQVAETITHVAGEVGDISESSTKQNDTMTSVVDHIREMTDRMAGIADTSEHISETSGKAGEAAKAGVSGVDSAVAAMEEIRATVDECAQAVAELDKGSAHIGEVIGAIQGIAEQTNLLALNAAIEAARAGEHGRGFAVVADEVRKLAEQSAEAAEDIAGTLSSVQGITQRAVSSMQAGTERVKNGSKVVNRAGGKFREIAGHIEEVDQLVKESARTASALSDDSMKMLEGAEHIEETTQKITGNISNISAATEEQSAAMEELAASSHGLADMAEKLQKEAAHFKF